MSRYLATRRNEKRCQSCNRGAAPLVCAGCPSRLCKQCAERGGGFCRSCLNIQIAVEETAIGKQELQSAAESAAQVEQATATLQSKWRVRP